MSVVRSRKRLKASPATADDQSDSLAFCKPKKNLIDLPREILGMIVEHAIKKHGWNCAMWMRLVCRSFDEEVMRVLCGPTLLEGPSFSLRRTREPFRTRHTCAKVFADRTKKYCLTRLIRETLTYVFERQPQQEPRAPEFATSLCMAAVKHRSSLIKLHSCPPDQCECRRRPGTALEHVLAAAVLLGLTSLAITLVQEGVQKANTEFGTALGHGAERNDVEVVHTLLEKGLSATARFSLCTSIENAARCGNKDVLEILMKPKSKRRCISHTRAAINGATYGGQMDLLQKTIGTVSLKDWRFRPRGYTRRWWLDGRDAIKPLADYVLWKACKAGQESVVRWALDQGANPQTLLVYAYRDILVCAAFRHHEAILHLLLEWHEKQFRKKHIPIWQGELNRALRAAARRGHVRIAQTLIDRGAHVNPSPSSLLQGGGNIPIVAAVKHGGQVDMVKLLINNGATLQEKVVRRDSEGDYYPRTAGRMLSRFAASRGYSKLYRILEAHDQLEQLHCSQPRG